MKADRGETLKLTQFSHGAGCGCKISPQQLDQILQGMQGNGQDFPHLLVGNSSRDDAAVFDLGDGTAVVSTTDFFMPIVDDPETFGRIAAANAISDIYAMGGRPLLAISILGWPVNKLPADVAGKVVAGGERTCHEAGIPLAGGHSIDSPEPIFGLAVTGRVDIRYLKRNGGAMPGDVIFLTKPLGIGIYSTAQKKGLSEPHDDAHAAEWMMKLNDVGAEVAKIEGVRAMTDVTGFGLGGHLIEMCSASGTTATIEFDRLPLLGASIHQHIEAGSIPGGTNRNFDSYGQKIRFRHIEERFIVCDPQTSGGLLLSVAPESADEIKSILDRNSVHCHPIGLMVKSTQYAIEVK